MRLVVTTLVALLLKSQADSERRSGGVYLGVALVESVVLSLHVRFPLLQPSDWRPERKQNESVIHVKA